MHEKKVSRLARASSNSAFFSLDDIPQGMLDEEIGPIHYRHDPACHPAERVILEEEKERLAAAIQRLPEAQRIVISLYYFEQLPLREIGRVLRVTDSRVCQIHRAALKRLERSLGEREFAPIALTGA
jgi:RNA polymerase sigma factor for flagellar operon FliA